MSLRVRILLFLFVFGLVPLMLAVIINLPLVLERVDLFYRAAFLQNLRADFSDLDQHLASRDASVRLLARLPEPGALVGNSGTMDDAEIDLARARYTQWINRILGQERDITEILFLDETGVERFWLERDSQSGDWQPTLRRPRGVAAEQVALMLAGRNSQVTLSPLRIDLETDDPARVFTLQLLSPIASAVPGEGPIGVVALTLDIAGLVRRDDKTLWVHDDGGYLKLPNLPARPGNAFADFEGLENDFQSNRIVLWEHDNRRAIWVPMFRTVGGGTLWVGRPVDHQPLQAFRTEIVIRVLLIVLGLVVFQFLVARWITRRVEDIGGQLTDGVRQTLQSDKPVVFDWGGSPELSQLADDLTKLSQMHARQTRNLRAHARELEATNRYKSEFLANVSHELRTPLNSMLLLSKLLSDPDTDLSAEARQRAEVIHKAGSDLKALIDNILDLSRIEAGRMELNVEAVSLIELLTDLRELLAPQFEAKGLQLLVDVAADAPAEVDTDTDKVRQVLKNFLANAVKFTDRGVVTLSAQKAAAPYRLALSVSDSGIGIAPDKQEAIFEAFQQADGSTSRRYGGTGLGLTISRQLAELLGGEIVLTSALGQGATFTLLLPAECGGHTVAPAAARRATPLPSNDDQPLVPTQLAGRRVLLMEPHVRNQLQLSNLLCGWDMAVHLADDLVEAMETLEELEGVDFLLIDALMPNDGACDTIKALRERLGESTVFIGLIPSDRQDAREACLNNGADDLLTMPADAATLSDVLIRHLPASVGQYGI